MESYLMMLYVTLEQESALKNFFVDHGWGFCKPDLSVTTDKLGPVVPNPPIPSEETSPPEADIPSQMTQTVPKIKNIPPSKPATETSTVRRGKRRTKSPKHISTPSKQAKVVASIPVPEPSESNETLATEAVESMENETLDTNEIRAPITVQVADGNQFTIKIEQEFQEADNEKREVDNSDVVDDCDDGDDDNDEETNVDYTLEGASTSDADTSVKTENLSLGDNSMNVDTAAKDGPSGKGKKRGKNRRQYNLSNLRDAYYKVKELGVSVSKASKIFNVPKSTLWDRVNNKVPSIDFTRSGARSVLSTDEEAKFTAHLMELAEIGYVYTQIEITRQASNYAIVLGKREEDNPFSTKWYKLYSGRQQECDRVRTVQSNQKFICVGEECIVKYYKKLNKVIHEYNLENKPDNIYLMDEIDLEMDETTTECKTVTVVGAGNAAGQIIPPYFIIVTGFQDEDSIFMRKSQLITKGFKNYLSSHFMKYVQRENEDEPIILLYDGHKTHLSLDLIEWAKDNQIVLFVIPPQECCIVKTRNTGVFEPLKKNYDKEYNNLLKQNDEAEESVDVISLAKHKYYDVVNAERLQSWFETSGIYPFQGGESMCGLLRSQDKLSFK